MSDKLNNNNENEIVLFAQTNYRNQRVKFGIKKDDRRRHVYLIGKTGMGKSTVLENMIVQDIRNGEGVAVVDPHGDLAEKIMEYIPSNRVNDVIYFNPADQEHPISFNVMEAVAQEHKHLIASGLVGVFKKLWADSWGPRLEYVLRNAILALLDYQGSTLLGVMRILVDKNYRKKVIAKIKDPVVKAFWVDEYSKYPTQFQTEAIAPIQNKVGQFLSTSLIRNIVGQVKSSIDLREIMDKKKILILNLSKGRVGEDASALMGAMMITKIQLAAMSRIDIPEHNRKDFYLYVDEFQNFATESFSNILSEARKYRLNLIIAHQYIEQVDELVMAAVFGNVGTLICFRIGAADAEFLVREFAPFFDEEDLVNLTKYDIYIRLMIDGVASNPFSATTLKPLTLEEKTGNTEKVIKVSREHYGKPKDVVEDKIARWSGVMDDEDMGEKIDNDSRRPPREDKRDERFERNRPPSNLEKNKYERPKIADRSVPKYSVNCYECGVPIEVNFRPDGVRPIYCKKCFQQLRGQIIKKTENESNTKEEISTPPPEISLTEALNKPLVLFSGKNKVKPTDEKEKTKEIKSNIKPDFSAKKEDRISVKIKSEKSDKQGEDSKNQIINILKPNNVVKF